jgi:hypothetical protein
VGLECYNVLVVHHNSSTGDRSTYDVVNMSEPWKDCSELQLSEIV